MTAGSPITDTDKRQVVDWLLSIGETPDNVSRGEIARHFDISDRRARTIRDELLLTWEKWTTPDRPVSQHESEEIDGNKRNIVLNGTRICSLEQLVEHCKVDLTIWEVERFVVNKWEVGAAGESGIQVEPLFQVKAWLKKKAAQAFAVDELNALREKAAGYAPKYPAIITRNLKESGNLLEVSVYDHHFGKLAWGKETGWADYDTNIAKVTYEAAFTALLARTSQHRLDELLLVLGNDLQNTDNRDGTTTKGTPQNTDTRYQKVFGITRDTMIWAVEASRQVAPRVNVMMVPGNHDFLTTWHLGDTLQAWFRNCDGVTVNNDPTFRKYHEHGGVMLGFTHGNAGKLEKYPLDMATEQPAMWGRTWWREMHTGDKHQRKLIEVNGVTVRIMPSLCPPDAWHSEAGYFGNIRAAEAYVWNKEEALIATAVHSIPERRREAA